ncbi:MAG: beta-galactosidase [Lachnospiraceae bacterium]|nr:beta-galactosidase [Lachnospiraceae bacterium]
MNKRKTALMLALICLLGIMIPQMNALAMEKPEYLKSVTYFGDEWPINYWGSEDKDMAANFEKIRQDGFNSIILVIPWREFQPNDGKQEFNQVALNRLKEVMTCAEQHGLWIVLRIGYTWDYYGVQELPKRFGGITKDNSLDRHSWIRYCEKIYETASAHSNFHSGFITWEDFWDYIHNMNREYSQREMTRLARESGYQKYLKEHYSLQEISEKYGQEFHYYEEIYVPYRKSPAAELFFEFYDQFLNKLLKESQAVFPGLSMEVRVDADRVYEVDGSSWYYSHKATYPCDGADYSAVMYSVSMGQKNESDRITAAQALAGSERTMSGVVALSGKKLYAEQLLYMDSTEEFSYNTQILDEEVDDYIRQLAPVLQRNTMGNGLWVYRNYVNNCVYNGQFGLGTTGWKFDGGSSVETIEGTPMAHIGNEKTIFQEIQGRLSCRDEITVEFYAKPKGSRTDVKVKLGNEEKTVKVTEAGTYSVKFPWIHSYNLELASNKDIYLDDIKVYSYEQYGRIYGVDGAEQDLADDFRVLNSQL